MKKTVYFAMTAAALCALFAFWLSAPETPRAAPKLAPILARAPAPPSDSTQTPTTLAASMPEPSAPTTASPSCEKSSQAISKLAAPFLASMPPWLHPSADNPLSEALESIQPGQDWTFKIAIYDNNSPHKARTRLASREEWIRLVREHSKEIAFHATMINAYELEGLIEARAPDCPALVDLPALRTGLLSYIDLSSTHAAAAPAVYYQTLSPGSGVLIGEGTIVVDDAAVSRKIMLGDLAIMRERFAHLGQTPSNNSSDDEPNAGEPTSVPQQP